jgi:signal transduction histidine kinase/ligand-binding sensor domain-containing protein
MNMRFFSRLQAARLAPLELQDRMSFFPIEGGPVPRIWMSAALAGALALRAAAAAERPAGAAQPAERLPVRVYTVDDGLAGDEINAIHQDSHGFLWIGTDSGLSRFDGSRFVAYDPRHGLPSPNVTALLAEPSGGLLVGTTGGLARLDPHPAAAGRLFRPAPDGAGSLHGRIAALLAEGGSVWVAGAPQTRQLAKVLQGAGTSYGSAGAPQTRQLAKVLQGAGTSYGSAGARLFRLHPAGDRRGPEEVEPPSGAALSAVTSLASDGAGGLWVGQPTGLLHRLAGGRWLAVPVRPPPQSEGVGALLLDAQRRLWVGTGGGLYVLGPGLSPAEGAAGGTLLERAAAGGCRQADPAALRLPEAPGEVCRFELAPAPAGPPPPARPGDRSSGDGPAAPPSDRGRLAGGMVQARDGKIWIVTAAGLTEFDGRRLRTYTSRNGLLRDELSGLAEDRDGNLWVGTRSHGLMRIAHHGFLTYTAPEAPDGIGVAAILEDSRSNLYVWGGHRGRPLLFLFDGEQLADVTPEAVARAGYPGRGRRQVLAPEASGELWLGAGAGIWRLPRVEEPAALRRAKAVRWQTPKEMGEVFRLFQDSRRQLWISSLGRQAPGAGAGEAISLARWNRDTGQFSPVPEVERLGRGAPSAFAEDPYGNLWIGFSGGGLARLRGGTAELIPEGAGGAPGAINDLFVDSRQRLWVATAYGGVLRLENLNARRPRSTPYTTARGLASDRVLCLTEDRRGNLYLGHGRGIDQLDPETGRIRTLTTADGLPSSVVTVAYRAHDGSLWFGTPAGPSRYQPEVPHGEAPPLVLLGDLRLGGVRVPLPPLGAHDLAGLELPAARNQVEVHLVGISFAYGAGLRYQYRLEGSSAGWSDPQPDRSVLLASLAPGDYRVLFRAVTPDNVVSPSPATLSFTLLRPLWQRWWALTLAAAAAGLLAWAFHHARLARVVELERVRRRIAADLHDDLSSSLSRISILAELARRRVAEPQAQAQEAAFIDQIGETARELMETTADIVWAIDARRDDLESLLVRIRRFAGDLLEERGVSVRFAAPPRAAEISLRPEAKRELYLVLKEALHNAARHAGASEVRIEVAERSGELVAEVRDDGVGFAPGDPGAGGARAGHGLRNIRERAAKLGAKLSVDSAPGAGTCVRLSLRL